jgi:hypothetical protein
VDGTVDPQGEWEEEGDGDQGRPLRDWSEEEEGKAGPDKMWLTVQEESGFSVEMLGGKRIVELVSAWDRLAPQLPPDVGRGAAAQVRALPGIQGGLGQLGLWHCS